MEEDEVGSVGDGFGSEGVPVGGEVMGLVSDDGEAASEEIAGEEADGEVDLAVAEDL